MKRALLLAVALCGCGNSFAPSSFVSGLRVLAVKADPPEVAPGQDTSLTVLAVDTAGATVQVTWVACTEPVLPSGGPINPDCFTAGPAPFLAPLGDGLAITATAPAVDPTVFGPPDASGGLYLPVILYATSAGSAVDGAYQLRLSQGGSPNRNPQLTGVFVVPASGAPVPLDEASPLEVHAGDAITLQAQFTADSAEAYQSAVASQSATVTEILRVSWCRRRPASVEK